MKILLATNNQGKIERFKNLLKHVDPEIEVCTPKELGIEVSEVEENSESLSENAEAKARAYLGKVEMPVLANDTGFFVEGEGLVHAPKRRALGENSEHQLSNEEIAEKLLEFWKDIATKHGGEVSAAWIESFTLLFPDGTLKKADSRREVILTDKEFGQAHIQMPIRALYISKTTGKPAIQHTEEEEIEEMQPIIEALRSVIN